MNPERAFAMNWKRNAIAAGFGLFRATGLHLAAGDLFRGRGVILAFHHVRPDAKKGFAPNALLEITPEFFDAILTRLRENGFAIVSLDEVTARLLTGEGGPFAALTFDDGYRDLLDHVLPTLEAHDAPATFYIAPGFADRTARLWWVELEEAIARLDIVELDLDGARLVLPAKSNDEKSAAFERVYTLLRAMSDERLLTETAKLGAQAALDPRALVEAHCLDWTDLRELAAHELIAIGAHSISHPRLSGLQVEAARAEMAESRDHLRQLGQPCRHFAYPYGDPLSAGQREFTLAAELGFATAVTTRPGMIFPEHAGHLRALPRLSANGLWQDLSCLDVLLSGAPFALWNRGRRLNVG
jgi:peptidoglycan/xylan/chitin deacetylase (PgdA/CDA1 family)